MWLQILSAILLIWEDWIFFWRRCNISSIVKLQRMPSLVFLRYLKIIIFICYRISRSFPLSFRSQTSFYFMFRYICFILFQENDTWYYQKYVLENQFYESYEWKDCGLYYLIVGILFSEWKQTWYFMLCLLKNGWKVK
jgi:hypothetical protein